MFVLAVSGRLFSEVSLQCVLFANVSELEIMF